MSSPELDYSISSQIHNYIAIDSMVLIIMNCCGHTKVCGCSF